MKFLKSKSLAALSLAFIVTLMPQRVDGASPPKDPFANYMKMYDYASVHKYRVINKNLYFQKDGQSGRFERKMNPKRINPHVNSQIYNATVSLLHGKYYTSTSYMPKMDTIPSRVILSFSPSEAYAMSGSTAFNYIFYDEQGDKYNSHITLTTSSLWYTDVSELNKDHAEAVYKAKLQNSINALFDENNEKAIFEFVFSEYLKSAKRQTKDGTVRKKKFGNINVVMEKRTVPTFYFSYVRKP
ncbi:hypothetical protein IHV10_20305 [Fictibacillus sp. 5RED26]|jgi:hypothetical protein|uniref:hypothetical protein n=1 Tax=Fictibacillus sp. 5RED26 TaxID=2745876 RepID=UPI0018CEF6D9|nr:hypothetical protein [Fictibacillus sp. 5RED26]MBH0158730.1 hypothetical protein [Fictibacillus sp. 5RED26]